MHKFEGPLRILLSLMDCQPYVNNLQPMFRAQVPQFKGGPVVFRSIKDSWYMSILLLILAAFFGVGIYAISQGWSAWNLDTDSTNTLAQDKLSIFVGLVLGMAGISILLCVLLIMCWRCNSQVQLNLSMIGMTASLLVFAMLCFDYGSIAGGVVILVILFVFLIMLCCCFSKHADTADQLVEATGQMMRGAGMMVSVPTMIMAIIGLVFSSFLAVAFAGIAQMSYVGRVQNIVSYVLYVALGTMYLLLMFFLYYSVSFLMGVAASFWYCQVTPPSKTIGLVWLFRYSLGTVTFASLMILIVKIMQCIVYLIERHWQTKCMRSLRCISRGLSSSVSGLLHTLNNHAIIVSAYTGQGLIKSAKIASVPVYGGYPLFNVIRVVGNFLFFSSLLFCLCLPTLISVAIANNTESLQDMSGLVGASVFLVSLLTSVVLLSTTIESLSSLFMLYSMDTKITSLGEQSISCQQETKEIFNRLSMRFNMVQMVPPSATNFALQ